MFGFFEEEKSATVAKNRLTIAIMSDRDRLNGYDFMDELKAEIIEVVQRYVGVRDIEIRKEFSDDMEALAIDVELDKIPNK